MVVNLDAIRASNLGIDRRNQSTIPNRFQLALAATYRARQLAQGHTPKIESRDKPTVTALREIAEGKVGIEMLKKVPT